jgi:hypothetical protein
VSSSRKIGWASCWTCSHSARHPGTDLTLRDWVRANRENLRARAAILRAKAEWEEHGKDEKFLLDPGVQLERGRAFLANPGDVAVDDIRDYVERSVEKDQRRLDSEWEAALAGQKRIANARKRTAQVAVAGLVVALLVAAAAVWQYLEATEATKIAKEASVEAEASAVQAKANLRGAQTTQSLFLTDKARQQRALADHGNALLLALEALPDDAANVHRPYVPEAELQLDGAWRDLRERLDLGHEDAVTSAAFSPDGKRIVTASSDKARVWDADSGKPIGEPLKGHEGAVESAAFSPDGKRIVTASRDKTARVWDADSGQPIGEPLKGHEGAVESAAFSPDGKRIVTASRDKTARVWDADSGKPIGEPLTGHEDAVWTAAFSPDGKRIVTASRDKTARVWDVFPDTQSLVAAAKAAVPRCLTSAQRKAWFLSPEPPDWCIEMEKWPYDTPAWKQWLADKRAGKTPPLPTAQ